MTPNCPGCGTELPGNAKFCLECGRAVAAPSAAPGAPSTGVERTPRDYTPKHLADRVLASRSALEGERKQVTVLFADVKGSMELASDLDPEAWHRILERFFEILAEGVHRFEGTVNQYTGDGIMALFGAPIAHEDHAQRACWAALDLRGALTRYGDELRMQNGLNFSVRMGLNSGEVVVGKIGDDLRMDYTAQGHSVGLAQRMEQLADAGKALLTEHTARLVEGYFELHDLGRTQIKGLAQPVGVCELVGPGAQRTRLDRSRARGFSRFVGRVAERAALDAALERTLEGTGQVVGVVAEAGTGKSRLCAEFVDGCRQRGIPVQEASGLAHGRNLPLVPILQLMRSVFGIEERDSDQTARDKIAGRIVLGDPALTQALPLVLDFMGVPDPARPASPLEPEERQRQLFDVVRRLTRARSERGPAVWLIEDLHWLDEESESFLEHLIEAVPGTRTLLVVNFRPEYRAGWSARSFYQQLPLHPLGPEDLRQLLDDLLGTDGSLASLVELICERTGGNPFFVEEIVHTLHEQGAIEGDRGAYRLVRSIEKLRLPTSVHGVLAARIDRLADSAKQVLQAASVAGSNFSRSLLAGVAEMQSDLDALDAAVRALIDAELVYEEYLYPEPEYAFKHPLVREVAYDAQLGESRMRRHAAAARAIETADAARLDERAALIAHHWEGADRPLDASRWHRRAAAWAGRTRIREALQHWTRVRELLGVDEQSAEGLELGVEARSALIILSRGLHGEEYGEQLLEESREMAQRSGSPRIRARALFVSGNHLTSIREFARGFADLEEAFQIASESDPELVRSVLPMYTVAMAIAVGPARAAEMVTRFEAEGGQDPDAGRAQMGISPLAAGLTYRGLYLAWAGQCELAQREAARGLALAREQADPAGLGLTEFNAVLLAYELADPDSAMLHARRALEAVEDQFGPALGIAHAAAGRWVEADEELDRRPVGPMQSHLFIHVRALAWHHRGRSQRAIDALRSAAEESRRTGSMMNEIRIRCCLAEILVESAGASAADEVRENLARVAELIARNGADLFTAQVHATRAKLHAALGDVDGQRRELDTARRLFVEMGAPARAAALA